MGKIPKIVLCMLMCIGVRCSTDIYREDCQKLSVGLLNLIEGSKNSNLVFDVVISLSDTTGLIAEFPMLTVPLPSVALGHLTKSQIFALCRHNTVLAIDRSKSFLPK